MARTRVRKGRMYSVTNVHVLSVGASIVDVYPKPITDGGTTINMSAAKLFDDPTPEDVVQGPRSVCYILADLITLSNSADGDAYLRDRIINGAVAGEVIVIFTRNGINTAVHVSSSIIPSQIDQTGPSGDIWVPAFLEAYAFFRNGADTVASLDYGFTNAVFTDLGLPNNPVQPRNTAEFYAMAQSGLSCTILTPPTPTQPGMVGSHAYGWDGALRNPWGPNAGMPLHITITDADIAGGVSMCANVAPPKASPAPAPTGPTMNAANFAASSTVVTDDSQAVTLSWNAPGAKHLTFARQNGPTDVVGSQGSLLAQRWQGPTFTLTVDGTTYAITLTIGTPTTPATTPTPTVPTLAGAIADLQSSNPSKPIAAAFFAAQFQGK